MKRITASMSVMVMAVALMLSVPVQGFAAEGRVTANVDRVLISDNDLWGGCMAALSVSPQSVLGSCGPTWVTFSCSGHFTDRVRAYRMLDQAQLAFATGARVAVWFEDDRRHNGYCFVNRLDILE
jgi:hypothetical protein